MSRRRGEDWQPFEGGARGDRRLSLDQTQGQNPDDGPKYYPHKEDKGHWDHYDYDENGQPKRYPEDCKKMQPNQKKPNPDQAPKDPWEKLKEEKPAAASGTHPKHKIA